MDLSRKLMQCAVFALGHVCLGTAILFAQTVPPPSAPASAPGAESPSGSAPQYEVASIRQNLSPEPHWRMNFTDNGVSAKDVTLFYAIQEAYGAYDEQLWINIPRWIQEKRFDIEARYDVEKYPHPTREQRSVMLQQLLADRFKLAIHPEQREFPIYALQIGKSGPKFIETKPQDAQISSLSGQIICHVTRSKPGSLGMNGCTMLQFAHDLTGWTRHTLGRTIIDRTGQNGHYDLSLDWSPQTGQTENTVDAGAGPSIFTALQEQLGLMLKSEKAPLPVMVIDHVEMPTEN